MSRKNIVAIEAVNQERYDAVISESSKQLAILLDSDLTSGNISWTGVKDAFLFRRTFSRQVIAELIRLGLERARGNYHTLAYDWGMLPRDDGRGRKVAYKGFLTFLRNYDLLLPYREFRRLVRANEQAPGQLQT